MPAGRMSNGAAAPARASQLGFAGRRFQNVPGQRGRGGLRSIILERIGEPTQAPCIAPAARGPPHGDEAFDSREVDTLALSQRPPEFDQRVNWWVLARARFGRPPPGL